MFKLTYVDNSCYGGEKKIKNYSKICKATSEPRYISGQKYGHKERNLVNTRFTSFNENTQVAQHK